MLEHAPGLLLLPIAGGIATIILFNIWKDNWEIRGRVLPLWILTLLHTLSFLLFSCMMNMHRGLAEIAGIILGWIYLCGIPVFLLFILIYATVLGIMNRMTRQIGLAAAIFAGNVILQPLIFILMGLLRPGLLE